MVFVDGKEWLVKQTTGNTSAHEAEIRGKLVSVDGTVWRWQAFAANLVRVQFREVWVWTLVLNNSRQESRRDRDVSRDGHGDGGRDGRGDGGRDGHGDGRRDGL